MTVLLVGADRMEFQGLDREFGRPIRLEWPVGHSVSYDRAGTRLIAVANGAGPALAAEATNTALDRESVHAVVSVGFCGGLNPALAAGDIFVAQAVRSNGESHAVRQPACQPECRRGVLLSVDRIVGTTEEKRELWANGCDAVEMEAAGVEPIATQRKLPFFCIRAVTDTAEEGFVCDLNAARTPEGRISRWRVVASAMRSPLYGVPELFRFRRRSKDAASRLAAYLWECEFEHV
jgi:adenosylhomocysteine nucleosidase